MIKVMWVIDLMNLMMMMIIRILLGQSDMGEGGMMAVREGAILNLAASLTSYSGR